MKPGFNAAQPHWRELDEGKREQRCAVLVAPTLTGAIPVSSTPPQSSEDPQSPTVGYAAHRGRESQNDTDQPSWFPNGLGRYVRPRTGMTLGVKTQNVAERRAKQGGGENGVGDDGKAQRGTRKQNRGTWAGHRSSMKNAPLNAHFDPVAHRACTKRTGKHVQAR